MRKIKSSSILAIIAIYVVLLFFPTSSTDDSWTYFKGIKMTISSPGTGSDLLASLLFLLPFIALIVTTYFFVVYARDTNSEVDILKRTQVSALITFILFLLFAGSLFWMNTGGITLVPILFPILAFAFLFSLRTSSSNNLGTRTQEETGNTTSSSSSNLLKSVGSKISKVVFVIVLVIFVLAGIGIGYTHFAKPRKEEDYSWAEKKYYDLLGENPGIAERRRKNLKEELHDLPWTSKIIYIVIYAAFGFVLYKIDQKAEFEIFEG